MERRAIKMSRALKVQSMLSDKDEERLERLRSPQHQPTPPLSTFERCCVLKGSTKNESDVLASCRDEARSLLLGDEFEETSQCSKMESTSNPQSLDHSSEYDVSSSPSTSVIPWLKQRLQIYESQWHSAQEKGYKSTLKRKAKRIAQYKNAIDDVKQGKFVDLSKLPDPFTDSPHKPEVLLERKSFATSSSIIDEENMGNPIEESPAVDSDKGNSSCLEKSENESTRIIKTQRKENYCIECKKMVKEFCKHYENVHRDTPEGKRLRELNELNDVSLRKKLKTDITDNLRKRGNAEFSKNEGIESFLRGDDAFVIPVKRFKKATPNQNNTLKCAHCTGVYNRRKFAQHLRLCKAKVGESSIENVGTKSKNTLPLLDAVPGASPELLNEIISTMKPREAKDVALRDPLIMKYASEYHKTRRTSFQRTYISRIITDLARVLMRMKEIHGENIQCLEDVFNPVYFSSLVECILREAGYDPESGSIKTCGLGNRYRSHIKGAAETAKKEALASEYAEGISGDKIKRKRIKHFLKVVKDKWANEVGRIFDMAVKKSRSEREPKLAAEEDIIKTCQYIISSYRVVIKQLEKSAPGSAEKRKAYNSLLDLLVTHIMCLIRRRPVDFKRALNVHYEKLDAQEDLINEIKNSKFMNITEEDIALSRKFKIFYVPGKGWKELVPIALTGIMKKALDTIQDNKKHVGISSDQLFVRSNGLEINPRECLRKVTAGLNLKKPVDMSGNGLRHHAGTFSKLHSSHPQYQDYLASALGHTLHIHKLHYEMPTSVIQKLVVCPVLHKMTQPVNEREESAQQCSRNLFNVSPNPSTSATAMKDSPRDVNIYEITPKKTKHYSVLHKMTPPVNEREESAQQCSRNIFNVSPIPSPSAIAMKESPRKVNIFEITPNKQQHCSEESDSSTSSGSEIKQRTYISRQRWTEEEKSVLYKAFGQHILECKQPPRNEVVRVYEKNRDIFQMRSVKTLVSFLNNKCRRKQKNVTPEVKRYLPSTHKNTNV